MIGVRGGPLGRFARGGSRGWPSMPSMPRHLHVHQDHVAGAGFPGLDGASAVARPRPARCRPAPAASAAPAVDRVVVGRQHPQRGQPVDVALGRGRQAGGGLGRRAPAASSTTKRRALARRAVDVDLPAHQRRQLAADRQPQPGAAEAAGGRGVGLGELLEQAAGDRPPSCRCRCRARSRRQPAPRRLRRSTATRAGLGELQRVGDQVVQHLAQPGRIAAIDARRAASISTRNARPLALASDREGAGGAVDQQADVELDLFQLAACRPRSWRGRARR